MYEDAEIELKKILQLVDSCPDVLKEKCFAILLQGYVDRQVRPTEAPPAVQQQTAPKHQSEAHDVSIPVELASRFRTTAKRLDVELDSLAGLFDFTTDPFTFHALHIPGTDKADKTRNVALMVAAKSYLTNGSWLADWKEIKAQCVDQNCYDPNNHASGLKKRTDLFKTVEPGKSIELSSGGVKEAEGLLKRLASGEQNAADK